jgi:hypothetical protein
MACHRKAETNSRQEMAFRIAEGHGNALKPWIRSACVKGMPGARPAAELLGSPMLAVKSYGSAIYSMKSQYITGFGNLDW